MFAFLAVAVAVIVVPGQDTALTLRNVFAGGRAAGVRTAAGVACGQAIWAVAAAAGLAAVIVAFEPAFVALKLLGAAYLIYLGACALRSAWSGRRVATDAPAHGSAHPFRQGLASNLANPKMAVFFTSLLPQFAASFPALLALGAAFCGLTFAWLTLYAYVIAAVGERAGVRRAVEAISGVALVALGARLATLEPARG